MASEITPGGIVAFALFCAAWGFAYVLFFVQYGTTAYWLTYVVMLVIFAIAYRVLTWWT